MVGGLGDKGEEAVDKGEAFVDEKTGDKFDLQTDKASDMATDAMGNVGGTGDEAQQAASDTAGSAESAAGDAASSAQDAADSARDDWGR
jgi:hypothetical protein